MKWGLPRSTRWARWSVSSLAALIALLLLASSSAARSSAPVGAPSPETSEGAGGLYALTDVQTVTGTPYFDTYCASQDPTAACAFPYGVTYYPPSGLIVLTQEGWSENHSLMPGAYGIVEVDPATLQNLTFMHVGCEPGVPFYPGWGTTVWVPCYNGAWTPSTVALGFDGLTDSVVANVSMPIWTVAWASYPSLGVIYAGGWSLNGTAANFAVLDPDTLSAEGSEYSAADFQVPWGPLNSPLVYDPFTGAILVASSGSSLLALDPSTGAIEATVSLPSSVVAASLDPATGMILVSTESPSDVLVLSASTYSIERVLSIPTCIDNLCDANTVNEIVIDPAHGDAYLVATTAFLTLNLTTLGIAGTIVGYGDGPQGAAAYAPASDRLFGTYGEVAGMDGPGYVVFLSHGSHQVLSQVLGLPTSPGLLLVAVLAGLILGVLRLRGRPAEPHPERKEVQLEDLLEPEERHRLGCDAPAAMTSGDTGAPTQDRPL
jgi:hypothetical protein